MEYRFLGKSGLKVSALSLGAWVTYGGQVGEDVATECMTAAYEAGVNFFDNAEAYARAKAEMDLEAQEVPNVHVRGKVEAVTIYVL